MKFEQLNLASLKYFIDTVESQGLTKAAEKNFVTRSAISQAILRLESWAGQNLITHEKKIFRLTKAGEDFYRRAKSSYMSFQNQLQGKVHESKSLKLGCSRSLIESHFLNALKKFKSVPDLELKVGSSEQLKRFLEDGTINVALFIDDIGLPGYKQEVISKGQYIVASRSGLIGKVLVMTEDRTEVHQLKQWLFNKKLSPQIMRAHSWSMAIKLAATFEGSALVPDFVADLTFKKVKMTNFNAHYQTMLLSRRKELLSEAEIQFCFYVKEHLSK